MGPLRVGGIALALSLASMLNFVFLFYLLEKKIGLIPGKKIVGSITKSVGASGVMGVLVWIIGRNWEKAGDVFLYKLFLLAGAIFLGVTTYLFIQYLINRQDVQDLIALFKRDRNRVKRPEK